VPSARGQILKPFEVRLEWGECLPLKGFIMVLKLPAPLECDITGNWGSLVPERWTVICT
jgi:hypothetical protein